MQCFSAVGCCLWVVSFNPTSEARIPKTERKPNTEARNWWSQRINAAHFFSGTGHRGFGLRISGCFRSSVIRISDFRFNHGQFTAIEQRTRLETDPQVSAGLSSVSSNPTPLIGNLNLSGSALGLSGRGGVPGSSYVVLTATNLMQPLPSWIPSQPN
jgi:hypothetical protein